MGLLGRVPRRQQPHIYSDAEIAALLREAGRLRPRGGLSATTYATFFSLLVSTGLRLSEACHLTGKDVDLDHGLLTIRESKFRKYAARLAMSALCLATANLKAGNKNQSA